MMNFGLSKFVVAVLLFCNNVKSASSYTCHNDTQTLNQILMNGGTGTYHICANTTIDAGVFDSQQGWVDGSFPVLMVNSGIKILCGENGSVENKCVFRDGDTGFEIINSGWYTNPATGPTGVAFLPGLHIEGFTFTGLALPIYSYPVLLNQVGLTVKNCKFVDNLNAQSIIKIQTSPHPSPNQIGVEDSHFIGNSIAAPLKQPGQPGDVAVGLIEVPYDARVSVSDSIFMNNTFLAPVGSNIVTEPPLFQGQTAGSVNVTDSCFVKNNNVTAGLLLVQYPNAGGVITGNHKDTNDFKEGGDICDGLLVIQPSKTGVCKLEGFNKTECSILQADAPTSAPTDAPTAATSGSLSMFPTARETVMILSFVFSTYLF